MYQTKAKVCKILREISLDLIFFHTVSFVFTPCQHWSKRTLTDANKSLWGSWVVKGPQFRFFFAGDTGYCEIFKQIGTLLGPFDVAAIPIGSYEPRNHMKHQHVNPEVSAKNMYRNSMLSNSNRYRRRSKFIAKFAANFRSPRIGAHSQCRMNIFSIHHYDYAKLSTSIT